MAQPGRLGIQRIDQNTGNAVVYGSIITQISTELITPDDRLEEAELGAKMPLNDRPTIDLRGEQPFLNSSHEEFPHPMLAGLAVEAWREMQSFPDECRPTVMTALHIGGEIILTSSIKRNGPGMQALLPTATLSQIMYDLSSRGQTAAFMDDIPQHEVLEFPIDARLGDYKKNGVVHRTGGSCGECAAVHSYFIRHPDAPKISREARVVTVGIRRNNPNVVVVFPPCGGQLVNGAWGCQQLTENLRIEACPEFMFGEFQRMTQRWQFVHTSVTF